MTDSRELRRARAMLERAREHVSMCEADVNRLERGESGRPSDDPDVCDLAAVLALGEEDRVTVCQRCYHQPAYCVCSLSDRLMGVDSEGRMPY